MVRVVGECKHSLGEILSRVVDPLCLAMINLVRPL